MAVKDVTQATFAQEVLQSEQPVMVDFWATWCAPCRMLGPVVDQVADELASSLKVCKVNIDEEMELAREYNVMSIPCIVIFKGGKEVNRSVGVVPKQKLSSLVEGL